MNLNRISGFTRTALIALTLFAGAASAKAEVFDINFQGILIPGGTAFTGTGSFTTNPASCVFGIICGPGFGLTAFSANLDNGLVVFNSTFDVNFNSLLGDLYTVGVGTPGTHTAFLNLFGFPNGSDTGTFTFGSRVGGGFGTFSFSPATVPEPKSIILLLTTLVVFGFVARRRHLAGLSQ